ncbi:hypothetical protein HAZT_HAZT003347, partial [Hyalella azteca]
MQVCGCQPSITGVMQSVRLSDGTEAAKKHIHSPAFVFTNQSPDMPTPCQGSVQATMQQRQQDCRVEVGMRHELYTRIRRANQTLRRDEKTERRAGRSTADAYVQNEKLLNGKTSIRLRTSARARTGFFNAFMSLMLIFLIWGLDEAATEGPDSPLTSHRSGGGVGSASPCPVSEHTCDNLQCVPRDKVCNGEDDCGDQSDERPGCT